MLWTVVIAALAFLFGLTAGLVLHTVAHGQWTKDLLGALNTMNALHTDLDAKVSRLLPPDLPPVSSP